MGWGRAPSDVVTHIPTPSLALQAEPLYLTPCASKSHAQHRVIPGPRSGARDPETQVAQDFTLSAALDSGLACGAPE